VHTNHGVPRYHRRLWKKETERVRDRPAQQVQALLRADVGSGTSSAARVPDGPRTSCLLISADPVPEWVPFDGNPFTTHHIVE
jgi:hypothetical protein